MILLLPSQATVLHAYAVLVGMTPGNAAFKEHQAFIATAGVGTAGYKSALEGYFAGTSTATMAASLLKNLGLSAAFTQAQAESFLAANAGNRAGAMLDLASQLYNYSGSDATLAAARANYATNIEASFVYSNDVANVNGRDSVGVGGQTVSLTTGFDNLVGTALNDTYVARTLNNGNTLQDGDKIDGGAGTDTVYADFNAVTGGAVHTPNFSNIETVVVRAQTNSTDATNQNNLGNALVQIDAQRSLTTDVANTVTAAAGVTRWEDNNSRADVVVEDVRIGTGQKTKDITIAMVETDPGNVDFGLYFDQLSLRNSSSGSSTLTINIMDTGAAGVTATAATPLLNNPYDTFKLGINGVLSSVALDKVAVAAADTYAQLLAVFNTALTGTGVTAALSGTFTITDPLSNKAVTGQSIVLSSSGNTVITTPTGSGWFNTTGASVPASSNIYTTFSNAATNVTELVTSTVVLDDVGRGSTGGDLLIGGLSVGATSTSRGVERFEITVNDNSRLQTINSTNNALREVTIVNGATSNTVANAYRTTVTNEGDLAVNGTNFVSPITGAAIDTIPADNVLPGANATVSANGVNGQASAINHVGAGAAGFTDVRLIDASAFKGKFEFTAAISTDTLVKYLNNRDTAASPTADVAGTGNVNFNVRGANFIYTGGNDNDSMVVTIDSTAASSRSVAQSGLSDFTFSLNGGAGDDAITTTVINNALSGGVQAWYNNQKLNANIAINGGDGNDTVRTPGAGDKIIDLGAGNDTAYTDNTGTLGATAVATGSATAAAIAYSNAAAAEMAAGLAANVASNTTGFVRVAGTEAAGSTYVTATAAATALNTLNLVTPDGTHAEVIAAGGAIPVHSVLIAAIDAATAAGGLTFAQNIALQGAYGNWTTAGTVTPAATLIDQAIAGSVATADATVVTAGQYDAGNALLATYITAAKTAQANGVAADLLIAAGAAYDMTGADAAGELMNVTQKAVVAATQAMNQVFDGVVAAGTQTVVSGLTALSGALVLGATDAQVVTALQTAIDNGSISAANAALVFTAATAIGANSMVAGDIAAVGVVLTPLQTTAAGLNAAAQVTLTNALAADVLIVNAQATFAAGDPVLAGLEASTPDDVGSTEATAALTTATAAVTAQQTVVTTATTKAANLAALKSAIAVASSELQVVTATANAVANGSIIAGDKTAIDDAAQTGAGSANPPAVGGAVDAAEKTAVDLLITALQLTSDADLASQTAQLTNLVAIQTATQTASTIATAAANSGAANLTVAAPRAVFVFDTSDQTATYNRVTMDERNLADLKSSANDSNAFFNSTVKVSYKGIDASGVLAGTGYKTTDLEINQKIKELINLDPVLSKLLLATDGPANSLVVTSLIDGAQATTALGVTLTMPTTVTAADLSGAITAYGLAAGTTDVALLALLTTAKTTFDARGDYVTQFAESGAAGGNTTLVGANSTSSSDNTITPGTGNDVIVLGTTVNTTATETLTSSNEKIVYSADIGADTIVNFAVSGNGIDQLDFTALNGRGTVALNSVTLDKSIVIGAPTALGATVLTAAQIAALFTDSATAINHVYVAVDSTNIGSIWTVADAAGVAAGNVTATLVGSIDLADTPWGTLTAANFA